MRTSDRAARQTAEGDTGRDGRIGGQKERSVRLVGWYAVVAAVAVGVLSALLALVVPVGTARAIWQGGLIAYLIQLSAFVLFVWLSRKRSVLAAWGVGVFVRFGALFAVALAAWRGAAGEGEVAGLLLSLVGFLFVLLMVEATFFAKGMQSS